MVHHQYVEDSFQNLARPHLQDEVSLDVQQNLDEQSPDAVLTFLDAVHRMHQLDVVADEEPHHRLRMDCYPDAVDVELHYRLRMDCYPDAVRQVLIEQKAPRVLRYFVRPRLALPAPDHVKLLTPQDLHRALLQALLLTLGLLLRFYLQRTSLLQPS